MNNVRILDVTLRDGGIVNDFKFGNKNMKSILNAIEDSGIKTIELGYLEKTKGSMSDRSQFLNEDAVDAFLTEKKPGVEYLCMFDYSKFDIELLKGRTKTGIDGIRFAFHKRNFKEAIPMYQKIIDLGYNVYMQPMVTMHYTEEELITLINEANKIAIKGIYFVDTFGQMKPKDVVRLAKFFDERLRKDIALGFHAHNNIQMAYANVMAFIDLDIKREKLVDCSIMGMGRGAGNANTELVLSYMNSEYHKNFNLKPVFDCMDDVIKPIKAEYEWGYSPEYLLSSLNDTSPIYAKTYLNEYGMRLSEMDEILKKVEGEKRISFKGDYARMVYDDFKMSQK